MFFIFVHEIFQYISWRFSIDLPDFSMDFPWIFHGHRMSSLLHRGTAAQAHHRLQGIAHLRHQGGENGARGEALVVRFGEVKEVEALVKQCETYGIYDMKGIWYIYMSYVMLYMLCYICHAIYHHGTNWCYTYPPEKYEFVRLDHNPNYWGK